MIDPRPAQGASHAGHDLFVIAAAADREADTVARAAAEQQMRDCADCASLFADLQAISAGLASMPRELPVPRDFRLTPKRAASLRPGGLRRLVGGFRFGPSLRPLGTALATLGFAGLFLTVGLPALMGSLGTSVPAILSTVGSSVSPEFGAGAAPPVASQASTDGKSGSIPPGDQSGAAGGGPSAAPAAVASAAPAASSDDVAMNAQASPGSGSARDTRGGSRGPEGLLESLETNPPDPLTIVAWLSLGALVVGLGLLLFARLGSRARSG